MATFPLVAKKTHESPETVESSSIRLRFCPPMVKIVKSTSNINIINCFSLTYTPFQRNLQQLLRFYGKFHRQFVQYLFCITVYNEPYGIFRSNSPLPAVEKLVFSDFGCRRFMLHHSAVVFIFYVRECMGAAFVSEQQTVALRKVSGIVCIFCHSYKAPIAVLAISGGDTFTYDSALCVFAYMNHFGSGICLLVIVGYGYGVEFRNRIVPFQDGARVFPCNRRACLYLCPEEFTVISFADPPFGYEIVYSSPAVPVSGVRHAAGFHLFEERCILRDSLHTSLRRLQ